MSIFSNIRRSLGFGPDISPESETDDLLNDSPEQNNAEETASAIAAEPENEMPKADPRQIQAVLDGVIALFNEAQPDFVRQCLSTEQQRKYAYERLDGSLRTYLEGLAADTERACTRQAAARQATLGAEAAELRNTGDQLRQKIDELRQQLVSTERQKRALADRVRQLETNAADFEAEREQADLLNRGLLNKIKVLGLQAGINPDELPELPDAPDTKPLNDEIEALKAQIEGLNSEKTDLQKQVESLSTELNQSADKTRIADQLADDLRRRAAEARTELEQTRQEYDAKIEALQAELKEANQMVVDVAEIEKQMEKAADMIAKRDERIRQLKQQVADLESQLAPTAGKIDFTAPSEAPRPAPVQPVEPKAQRQRPIATDAPTISDNDLAEIDRSFGYHPPKRTPVPDNDAQMSLNFD